MKAELLPLHITGKDIGNNDNGQQEDSVNTTFRLFGEWFQLRHFQQI